MKGGASGLQFGFPFDKLFQKQVLAVEYGIGEIVYPVAEDKDAGGGTQHQIQFDVPMAVDEEVYIRMVLQILFGIQYKMLVVFAHVVGLFPVYSFQAAVLCPPQSELYAPAGVEGGEQRLEGTAVKHGTQQFEFFVRVAQSVAVGKVELFSVDIRGEVFAVNDYPALPGKVIPAPDIMVAGEEVYFHAHIRQFGQLAEKAGVAFGHDRAELVPEVEHVAQQLYGGCFVLDPVEKVPQPSILCTSVLDGPRTQVCV